MLAVAFVRWWYGTGWTLLVHNSQRRIERTLLSFSVPTLIQTLFAPWKRIITHPGAGLEAKLRAAGDNAMSRLVGFTVRLIVLISAGVVLVFMLVASFVQIILWPLLPILVVVCLAKAVV